MNIFELTGLYSTIQLGKGGPKLADTSGALAARNSFGINTASKSQRRLFAYPIISGAHTWNALTPFNVAFDTIEKLLITSDFATGNSTTVGDVSPITTGGDICIGRDADGANQFNGLVSESRLWA